LEKHVFLSLIGSEDVVCDIGANQGHFTQLFSDLVGSKGQVHAFEPGPAIEKLRIIMTDGTFNNTTITNAGLSDTAGKATLLVPGDANGQASLRSQQAGCWADGADVVKHPCRLLTLDDYAAGFSRLDFIKCDIEGAELPCMRGAKSTLMKFQPLLFLEVCEEWTRSFGYNALDLIAFLREAGYDHFIVAAEKLTTLEAADFSTSLNLLCGIREKHSKQFSQLKGL